MSQMPAASKDTASHVRDFGPAEDRSEDLSDYTVSFVSIRRSHDLAGLLSGLPGRHCSCPHWGYVFKGSITVRYGDREETFGPGQAFYMPPGHVPGAVAGTELVQFSPAAELQKVEAAMLAAMSGGPDGG
jgi:mannose-6-phosphate isomerase-like protein (cupin superfamily)